jgi:hypothetical protein
MIVRDEAARLADAIESTRGIAREWVIVDTGSRDGTAALAASLGARVLQFDWIDDFSAARNFALDAAREDWILSIDADQRLDPTSKEALTRALQQPVQAQIVTVDMFGPQALPGAPAMTIGSYPALRLFRRDPRIRYRGRVHEDIARSLVEIGCSPWPDSGVRLADVGYADAAERARKRERNLRLLHWSIQEEPENLFVAYKLADTLPRGQGDERRTVLARAALQARAMDPLRLRTLPFAHRLFALLLDQLVEDGRLQEAVEVAGDLAAKLGPGSDFAAGRVFARAGDAPRAREFLQRYLDPPSQDPGSLLLPDPAANAALACRWLAWVAFMEAAYDEAQSWNARARACAAGHQLLAIDCDALRIPLARGDLVAGAAQLQALMTRVPLELRRSPELMLLAGELSIATGDKAGAIPLLQAALRPDDDRAAAHLATLALDAEQAQEPGSAMAIPEIAPIAGRCFDTLAVRRRLAQRRGVPLDFAVPSATLRLAAARGWG